MTSTAPPAPVRYRNKRSAVQSLLARFGGATSAVSAMVEVADRCNEACVHCYQVQGQKGELTTEQLKQVFDELAALGVLMLTISGGEPTLRRDFLELVAYARQLKFAVKIYSNGLNIGPDLAQRLGELAVQEVQLSLYSDVPELHDQVTRVSGSFQKTTAAARHLRDAGVKVVLKTPLMRANAERIPQYTELVTSLGADFAIDPNLVLREDGSAQPREVWVDAAAYVSVSRSLAKPRATQQIPLHARPCAACSQNVHVEANGELRPCAQWSVPTGHALEGGVVDAWRNNGKALAIRGLNWAALPACRRCDLRSYCTRCFAQAQLEVGDARSPYENACQRARWEYEVRHGRAPEIEVLAGSGAIGPYRHTSEHHFVREDYAHDSADEARLAENPWLRSERGESPPATAGLGHLVQLRRSRSAPLT